MPLGASDGAVVQDDGAEPVSHEVLAAVPVDDDQIRVDLGEPDLHASRSELADEKVDERLETGWNPTLGHGGDHPGQTVPFTSVAPESSREGEGPERRERNG
jgi:hypothetical protein